MDGDRNGILVDEVLNRLLAVLADSSSQNRMECILLCKHCLENRLYAESRVPILEALSMDQDEDEENREVIRSILQSFVV